MRGIEPLTPCLQSRCSPSWATPPYLVIEVSLTDYFREPFIHSTVTESRTTRNRIPRVSISSIFLVWSILIREYPLGHPHVLHRKEVIQPHLPIRLPCYDLTPIIEPTLGSYLTRLVYWLWVFPTFMVWRAVCTKPGNVFTAACWSAITSNSNFIQASFSLQSELGRFLWDLLHLAVLLPFVFAIVVRV